jgi:hypothetical protein
MGAIMAAVFSPFSQHRSGGGVSMKPTIATCLLVAVLCAGCATAGREQSVMLLGDPAPEAAASKVIVLTPAAKHVNVIGGETVRFVAGDKSFAWNFSGPEEVSSFDLARVAPPGTLDHSVIAYVSPNPLYLGGGRHGGRGGHHH